MKMKRKGIPIPSPIVSHTEVAWSSNKNDDIITVALLKDCASNNDLLEGIRVHDFIVRNGLLGKSLYLWSSLVSMYAKCGALAEAQQVHDQLPIRNEVTWNVFLSGYVQYGKCQEMVRCFHVMQSECLLPTSVTFLYALKACIIAKDFDKVKQMHNDIVFKGFLENDIVLGTALVDTYAKLGFMDKAHQVLDVLPLRNVVTWNTIITGYVHHGKGKEALQCFECMQNEGFSPDTVTLLSIFKACSITVNVNKGKRIHDMFVSKAMLNEDVMLCTALVDMYAKCGALENAKQVLNYIPAQNVAAWNALIAGYVQHGQALEALICFDQIQIKGIAPSSITFICALKACSSTQQIEKGKQIHDDITTLRLVNDDFMVGAALVDMYSKCGSLEKAIEVFGDLPIRNVVTWNTLIAGYAQHGWSREALRCFEQMQSEGLYPDHVSFISILKACGNITSLHNGKQIHNVVLNRGLMVDDIVLGTAVMEMYAKCGALPCARQVLDELHFPNIISWNTLISGYAQQGQGKNAINCLDQMQRDGIYPDAITFNHILRACGTICDIDKGKQFHGEIVKKQLLEKDFVLGTALVDMYVKFQDLTEARNILKGLRVQDVGSWNALINGYSQQSQSDEALNCYHQMLSKGLSPDPITFICTVKACGSSGAIDKGKQFHSILVYNGLMRNDMILSTTVIDMYAKCGAMTKAEKVLNELPVRNRICWSALITGYAQEGLGEKAIDCFKRMERDGFSPDAVTLLSILNACNHSGLVDKGEMYFLDMSKKYALTPDLDHYTCMVDLYGRAGHLEKAVLFIKDMPCTFDHPPVWDALLSSCRKWANINIGRMAFKQAVRLNVNNTAAYLTMTNIYLTAGMTEEAEKIEVMRVKNSVECLSCG